MHDSPFGSGGSLDGCIRIGERKKSEKTGNMFPAKLDYFIATHPFDKDADAAPKHQAMNKILADLHGPKPQKVTIVLGNSRPEQVFQSGFAFWPGKNCKCRSADGKTAQRRQDDGTLTTIECDRKTCPYADPNLKVKCKPYGILRFLLEHAPKSGGHWKFTTHSWHSVKKLTANLKAFYEYTADLNGLELDLVIEFETATVDGKLTRVPTVRLSSNLSPAELAAGMGRKFTDPKKVRVFTPEIKINEKDAETALQEDNDALGLNTDTQSDPFDNYL